MKRPQIRARLLSPAQTFSILPQASWNGRSNTPLTPTWTNFTIAGAAAANNGFGEYKLYLRGSSNNYITGNYYNSPPWKINAAGQVACSGNIETLLDYTTVANGGHPAMANNCFANLFRNCTALTQAPALSATTLADRCYHLIFYGCTGLTQAPALPATNLADYCYYGMFAGCTG